MPQIELFTTIHAPVERCFQLSLSVDVHTLSTVHTREEAIDGIRSGIMKLGDFVTWRAKHFGIWQQLTSRITEYHYPTYFCDEMIKGAFKSIRHEHHFTPEHGTTLMKDVFIFETPLGILGNLVNKLVLESYMRNLLTKRNQVIKKVAEGEEWKRLLTEQ